MCGLETCYLTHLFELLSFIHFKSYDDLCNLFNWSLSSQIHVGNDLPFFVLLFHADKGCVIPVFLSRMFCLLYFNPCWGLCFTNCNRTIL